MFSRTVCLLIRRRTHVVLFLSYTTQLYKCVYSKRLLLHKQNTLVRISAIQATHQGGAIGHHLQFLPPKRNPNHRFPYYTLHHILLHHIHMMPMCAVR